MSSRSCNQQHSHAHTVVVARTVRSSLSCLHRYVKHAITSARSSHSLHPPHSPINAAHTSSSTTTTNVTSTADVDAHTVSSPITFDVDAHQASSPITFSFPPLPSHASTLSFRNGGLVRDFISSSLYSGAVGYFNTQPRIHSSDPIPFDTLPTRNVYYKFQQSLYNKVDSCWLTPVEIFKVYTNTSIIPLTCVHSHTITLTHAHMCPSRILIAASH